MTVTRRSVPYSIKTSRDSGVFTSASVRTEAAVTFAYRQLSYFSNGTTRFPALESASADSLTSGYDLRKPLPDFFLEVGILWKTMNDLPSSGSNQVQGLLKRPAFVTALHYAQNKLLGLKFVFNQRRHQDGDFPPLFLFCMIHNHLKVPLRNCLQCCEVLLKRAVGKSILPTENCRRIQPAG